MPPPSADDLPGRSAPEPRQSRGGGKRRQGNARKRYLLVACTNLLTYCFLGRPVLGAFSRTCSGTALVHDRYQNYDSIPGVKHQLCCAHILHEFQDVAGHTGRDLAGPGPRSWVRTHVG